MVSMYNQLIRLYEGIINIDSYYSKGTPLNTLSIVPQYVVNAVLHHASVDNLEKAEFGILINIGDKDYPVYVVTVDNGDNLAMTDIAISFKNANPVPVVIVPEKLFASAEEITIDEVTNILHSIFFSYLDNDSALSIIPDIEVLNLPYMDGGIGHKLQSYDYTIIVATINMIHSILATWFGKHEADTAVETLLNNHGIISTQIESVKAVCDDESSFDYKIEHGLYLVKFFE